MMTSSDPRFSALPRVSNPKPTIGCTNWMAPHQRRNAGVEDFRDLVQ